MSADIYFNWKQKLINTNYRRIQLRSCTDINDDLEKDIDRTFPSNAWFTEDRKNKIKNILLHYVIMNKGVSYCQGMCFIMFTLYHVFHVSDYAEIETLYCFHKLIEPIRPIYPLNQNDTKPIVFLDNLCKVILLKIHKKNILFAERLSELNIVQYFVISGLPALFANWYKLSDVIILWDRLIDSSAERTYDNIVDFLVDYFLSMKDIMNMEMTDILTLLSKQRELKLYK
ncbi:MAG: hypothetical protein CL881_03885 [Dehalococcoidia bacterium]|nr:hypothetical protein [Dehalococcoidia bacterium]